METESLQACMQMRTEQKDLRPQSGEKGNRRSGWVDTCPIVCARESKRRTPVKTVVQMVLHEAGPKDQS